jgi:hypothetical protein
MKARQNYLRLFYLSEGISTTCVDLHKCDVMNFWILLFKEAYKIVQNITDTYNKHNGT